MSNSKALTVYDRMPNPLEAVQVLGRAIAMSQMFGVQSEAQGQIFALECLTRGTPPLALAERYHVIFGKLSMKADTMLAEFHVRGGKSRIIMRSADKAEIELEKDGDKQRFAFTWDEAQKESFVYEGKPKELMPKFYAYVAGKGPQPELKDKYATPRSRMQMLWARVVSDGVRAMMPEVNSGAYTAEELGGSDDEPNANANGNGQGDVVDAEYEVKSESPVVSPAAAAASAATETPVAATPQGSATASLNEPGSCHEAQRVEIEGLFSRLGLNLEQRENALKKRHAAVVRNLSYAAASELIATLKAKWEAVRDASLAKANGRESAPEKNAESAPNDGPCSETQVNKVKGLLAEIEQVKPGFMKDFKARFFASGREKIADLTHDECADLIRALGVKNMDAFFADSLKPKVKAEPVSEPDSEQAREPELVGASSGN